MEIMGPPERGAKVRIISKGLDILIRVDDEVDKDIVLKALNIAERRRYGRTLTNHKERP